MNLFLTKPEEKKLEELQREVKERWQYVRVTSILMLSKGFSADQTSKILGIDDNSVYRYQKCFKEESLEALLSRDYKINAYKLDHVSVLKVKEELTNKLYLTSKEVCQWVEDTFEITYTEQGMIRLLHDLGFSYKKTKSIPCEASKEKQETFLKDLDLYLSEQNTATYYTDGVHPTHNTRSLYGWISTGKEFEIPTVSGRDRININGAVEASNPTDVIIEVSETINAESTKLLYQKIIEANLDKDKIYIISDNARYYRNKELAKWIENTKIIQVFLPPYSPNLNLIERLWKFMRKKAIDPIFYRTKEKFREGILLFFKNIENYKIELETLLTLNFRVINSQFNI